MIGNSSALTMFAAGRTTGIAVECGAGLTSSVPVFEGIYAYICVYQHVHYLHMYAYKNKYV
jgi:actin-related protein